MSYLHEVLESGDPKAIEKLIRNGEYGEAKKEISDVILEIRSLEAEYDRAKKRYLLLKSEVQRLKSEGVIIPDRTGKVMSLMEAGRFGDALVRADDLISQLRFVEEEYNAAKAAYLLLKNETDRIKRKSVIIIDHSADIEDFLASGRYREAVTPATEYINDIRNVESLFDSASAGKRMLEIEITRVTGKEVMLPVTVSPVDQLIQEGRYVDASLRADELISVVRNVEADYDSASSILRILQSELSRLRDMGVVVPFDSGEPESLKGSGDYGKSLKKSESLLSKLKKTESDYNTAENSLVLLISEVERLSAAGMVIPFELDEGNSLFYSGEYRKSDRKSRSLLKKLRGRENEFDQAGGALSLLESEIGRVTDKGMIIPYTSADVRELIGEGSYKKAKNEAEEIVRKIRELERDYDIVINLFDIIGDEIALLSERGVSVPFDTVDLDGLINKGRYGEAIPLAKELLAKLRELEDDFFKRLQKELDRLRGLGIIVPFDAGDVDKALKSGDHAVARAKAEDLFMLLHSVESDFNGANDALSRLKDEIDRLKAKGVMVPDMTGHIEELIGNGDYKESRDESFRQLSVLKGIEKDYDSAYDSLEELKSAISLADEKGIVHPVAPDEVKSLLAEGKYHEAGRDCRKAIIILRELEDLYDIATELLSRLDEEIKRLRKKGVCVPDETERIRELIRNGDYLPARDEALGHLFVLRGIEKDYDSAYDSLEELKSAISSADKKGIVHCIGTDDIISLLSEGRYQEAGRDCRERLVLLNGICKDFEGASGALNMLRDEIKRLTGKGVIVPDETERISEMITSGDFSKARDESFRQLSVLKGIEDDYTAAVQALNLLSNEIRKGLEKGIQVPDETDKVKTLVDAGKYKKAAETATKELIIVRGIIAEYSHAIEALEKLEKEIFRLRSKGVLVPDETVKVRDLIRSGDYRKATDEAYSQIIHIRGIEKDFDDATESLSNLTEETKRLIEKGVVFNDESEQLDAMMSAGEYDRVIIYSNALLVTILSSEKDYDAAIEAYDSLISEAERLRGMGVVIPDESGRVKDSIRAGEYTDARAGANALLVRIVSIAKDYDVAIESLTFLKSEISRIREKGIVISGDISGIEKLIGKGEYHNARISANSRVLEARSTEAEYEDARDAYGTLSSEDERLKEKGVVFDEDHRSIDKLFGKGSYREARKKIEARIIKNKITEAEFESAVSVLKTLEMEIGRLEKKGVLFNVRAEPVRELIGTGEYSPARDEAESGLTKLWAAESDFDSALEALDNLRKEYVRVTRKGVVLPDESGEVGELIGDGHYHPARSRAEFIMSGIRKVEDAYDDAIASLSSLRSEMDRLKETGVIFDMDSSEISALIDKGMYSEADDLADHLLSGLRKIEIEYTSAMEVLAALEDEISRLKDAGVIFTEDGSPVRKLTGRGEYSKAITESENILSSLRKTEIEFNASIDAIRKLKAEITRLKKRSVVIDEDTSPEDAHHARGRYSQSRKAAESHVARIKAVEIEYDSAVDALGQLGEEITRLKKKGVMISEDVSSAESLIDAGEYRKAKKSADGILTLVKKVEREYDAAMEVLKVLKSEHSRMTRKGVILKLSPSEIAKLIAGGEYNSARKDGDSMISMIRDTESVYDAAVSALDLYRRDLSRANANKIPVKDESASVEKMLAKGAYKDAKLESEALVSKVKAFEWEYELTISAYETLKNEVARLKKDGIVITDDPTQVEEFIKKGSYGQAKSISEGLLSKFKGVEWEYRLAIRAYESLRNSIDRIKKAGKKPGVDTREVEEWIRRGDYRKAKSVAEDLVSVIGE